MSQPHIRAFDIDTDAESATALRNATLQDNPVTTEELRDSIQRYYRDRFVSRAMASLDGNDLGYAVATVPPGGDQATVLIHVFSSVDEAYDALLNYQTEQARLQSATKVITWIRSCEGVRACRLERLGYQQGQRNPESCLELKDLPADAWNAVDNVQALGYELMNLVDLKRLDPERYAKRSYNLEMNLMKDVPMPVPFEPMPFEHFCLYLDDPYLNPNAIYFALWGDELVGTSQLMPNKADPRIASTGLTGVLAEHRRKGLATALKLKTYAWGSQYGVERVYTDNEENNPMYALNQRLGFKRVWDWICFERQI